MKLSALNPFRFRALLPGVLAAGLLLGIWLGDLFKGFGWGPGQGGSNSTGTAKPKSASTADEDEADLVGVRATDVPAKTTSVKKSKDAAQEDDGPIHARIDGRSYYVVHGKQQESIDLAALIERIRDAQPNEDGVRAIIDLTRDSRPSAEEKLKKGLQDAGLTDAVYWPGRAVD